ncbi:MAG: hypothetical protein EA349_14670 [Halomonadaceae bacterium]|nr:MAG: hypothetical protein EA349_14670 [Halomonadaceae bacterium]
MADLHIEEFYQDSGKILLQLYRVFPRPTSVFVEDIAGADCADEFGLHGKRHLACLGTMLWLAEENLIRYDSLISQDAIDQGVLTQQGLATLIRLLPAYSGEGQQSLSAIHNIQHCLHHGTSTQMASLMQQVLFPHLTRGSDQA